jgi:hypothetical protein
VPVLWGLLRAAGFTFLAASANAGYATIGYLTTAFLCLSAADSGIFTLPVLIVPQSAAGTAFGFVNTAAQCAGFLSRCSLGTSWMPAQGLRSHAVLLRRLPGRVCRGGRSDTSANGR